MAASIWIVVITLIIGLLILDFYSLNIRAREVHVKEALAWTIVWFVLALCFNVLVYFLYENNWLGWTNLASHSSSGWQAAVQFLTGFIMEKSLSVDNIFVIAMIFSYLKIPVIEQQRLLLWSVLGAIGLRAVMIALGAMFMIHFQWIVYIFGGLLIATAVKMLMIRQDDINIGHNPLMLFAKKFYPITDSSRGGRFFSTMKESRAITPLFLALVLVTSSNLIFAIDSIPAIFAVTQDSFLVFTSNVLAVLGLRALYFTIGGYVDRFRYIKLSLVFILIYLAIKIMLIHHYPISNMISLVIISTVLIMGILASLFLPPMDIRKSVKPLFNDMVTLAVISYRQARRIVVLILGTSVLLVGIAMIVLPGPAIVVIPVGLGILAIEFTWAKRWLKKVRQVAEKINRRIRG